MAAPRTAPRPDARSIRTPAARTARPRRITGPARLDRRTKRLVGRLALGDVAIVEHRDLDRMSAEDLVAAGAACVVNVAASSSGRYPNEGPSILAEAGVHLIDVQGAPLFDAVDEGDLVSVEGTRVLRDGRLVAEGRVIDRAAAGRLREAARREIAAALEAFAANTMAHLRDEGDLLAGRLDLPDLDTALRARPALVVVRGVDHARDLRALAPFVREQQPTRVAVDGGADALLDAGMAPDLIVGDMDSASDRALASGAELVVHAYSDGRAPGRARLEQLGLRHKTLPAPGTSEDAALLLAAEKGARPIVSVGSPFNLVEFLDRARDGMASSFLTRLRLGESLIDARGLSRLYGM
ncbi:MAG TPA: putative cytokinetic ring protein SteA [Thermoleophilaceae bacterium]|nr:putative cytokinetic ring protein SteA [Thermoleophilaceae bacterium]